MKSGSTTMRTSSLLLKAPGNRSKRKRAVPTEKRQNDIEEAHLNGVYNLGKIDIMAFGIDRNIVRRMLTSLEQFSGVGGNGSPDLVYRTDEGVLGVEHFRYDASKTDSKGSSEARSLETASDTFCVNAASAFLSGDISEVAQKESMKIASNNDYMVDSFLKAFKKHEKKLIAYKKNVENVYKNEVLNDVWFIAEDTSADAPAVDIPGYGSVGMTPIFFDECIDAVRESNVGGIIFMISNKCGDCAIALRNTNDGVAQVRALAEQIGIEEVDYNQTLSIERIAFR